MMKKKLTENNCHEWKLTAVDPMKEGAQWLSGRVLDSRPRGHGLEPHWCQCVVFLSKTHLS